ncbi:GspH/FimT family pseudopilin [Atopomonas hussainii]|uniref:GspH/FimT family pseudopilin n=1 Tax=Atopomonas hussainii TaxID=1429083 RepID=UPI0009000C0B|nr:GspH/FimT family pseudopilin [Atopomonas hussainii]
MSKLTGFTLLECCTCLSILTISSCLALPLINALERGQLEQDANNIRAAITMARTKALTTSTKTTVCCLDSTNACTETWHNAVSTFLDLNANRVLDQNEQILNVTQWSPKTQIQWRGMGTKGALHFSAAGITQVSNGTLQLQRAGHTINIIVNRQGRVRQVSVPNR